MYSMWGGFFVRNLWTDTPVLTRLPGTQKSSVVLFAAFIYNGLSAVEESDVLGGIPYAPEPQSALGEIDTGLR